MRTTVRSSTLSLPVAPIGPENPLPALSPLDELHTLDERERAALPADMARQVGYAPLRSVLPTRILDGYGRRRTRTELPTVVVENDRLRATVLPTLGGRIHSLHHKPTRRELLYTNPVLQPADFALNGAWFSGGIEWNIGATGHTTLSCAPLHAARVTAPDGGTMLRMWEWERLRDTPFQVDLWLPDGSDFLYVGVRIRNPHPHTVPVYWWSNTAVPEDERTRVLAPAEETWHFGYQRSLRRIPLPEWDGADRSYPTRSVFPADYFHEVPDTARKWIASVDSGGSGLVQTSTDLLRGRKLFVWGSGPGGRRWQRWLTEEGAPGYAEIQAGLARTQLEHVPLEAGGEFTWLEAYGPLHADPGLVHGPDWAVARRAVEERLENALPRRQVDEAYQAWRPYADAEPELPLLSAGSGWGALETARTGERLPGTPFPEDTLGPEQQPWLDLLNGRPLAAGPLGADPGPSLVAPHWRASLEAAPPGPYADFHLGVAHWHAGDRSRAVRSWQRAVGAGGGNSPRAAGSDGDDRAGTAPALRCLAVAAQQAGDRARAADYHLRAVRRAEADRAAAGSAGPHAAARWTPMLTALAREAVPALLAADRAGDAAAVPASLPAEVRRRGRFRLLHARVLAARGDRAAARAVFAEGFEVDDLREGDEILGDTWAEISDEPLPEPYDFRMRPA